jgi:hypothetical protein
MEVIQSLYYTALTSSFAMPCRRTPNLQLARQSIMSRRVAILPRLRYHTYSCSWYCPPCSNIPALPSMHPTCIGLTYAPKPCERPLAALYCPLAFVPMQVIHLICSRSIPIALELLCRMQQCCIERAWRRCGRQCRKKKSTVARLHSL